METKIYEEFTEHCLEMICGWEEEHQKDFSRRSLSINDAGLWWLENHYPDHATREFADAMIDYAIKQIDESFEE